jgi:hypothetical protein
MAWTDIDLYRIPHLMTASDVTLLRDNINYLNRPNAATYQHPGTGSDYTVTGSLGQDLDATNFNLSITTTGGLVIACLFCQVSVTAGTVRLNIVRVDEVSHIGHNMFTTWAVESGGTDADGVPASCICFFPNLPAGTHSFKVIWGINPTTETGTMNVDYKPRFSVWEI